MGISTSGGMQNRETESRSLGMIVTSCFAKNIFLGHFLIVSQEIAPKNSTKVLCQFRIPSLAKNRFVSYFLIVS